MVESYTRSYSRQKIAYAFLVLLKINRRCAPYDFNPVENIVIPSNPDLYYVPLYCTQQYIIKNTHRNT